MSSSAKSSAAGARGSFAGGAIAVFRHELRLLLHAPLSYLFMAGFSLALSAAVFLIADLYSTDEASLHLMLLFTPWIGVVLVPALAMGMWADEKTDRSAELMLTLPLRLGSIVVGKFLAGYAVLMLSLMLTFAIPATLVYLGEPDVMRIIAGYLALALMLALFFAAALFAAAVVRDRVGAFVIGLVVLFGLLLVGWDVFAAVLKPYLPLQVLDVLALFSPRTWVLRMGEGLVELAAIFYFLGTSAVFLLAAGMVIEARRQGGGTRRRGVGRAVALFAALAVLAVGVPRLADMPLAADFTAEKEFTLSSGTGRILARLPTDTTATLYWSAGEHSVPVTIKSHARRVRNLLKNMMAHAGGRLKLLEIDPLPDSDDELQAIGNGVRRVPMTSGDHFFFGMTITDGSRVGNIPYFDIERDRFLEYDIALALNGLTRAATPKLGILSPLLPSSAATGQAKGLSFLAELKHAYDIAVIPYFKPELPPGLDALMLIDASILRREMLYAIDQFVMGGGSLIVMMDPYLRFNRASNAVNPSPSVEINDISDLVAKWGARYNGASVVGDARAASPVADGQDARMSFPFWMRFRKNGLSADHPSTANLNEVFFVEPGSLELQGPRAQALVTTSSQSGTQPRKGYERMTPRGLASAFNPKGGPRILAAALSGPFESAFGSVLPDIEGAQARPHMARSEGSGQVFVVADVDWLFDPFSLQRVQLDGRTVVRPLNDNLALLLNMAELATGDAALTSIRSRGQLQRTFLRVHALFKAAEEQYRAEEAALVQRVSGIETRMAAALKAVGGQDASKVPAGMKDEIAAFRRELIDARKRLRDLRRLIRTEIETLGHRLTMLNFAAGPLLIGLLWLVVGVWRRRAGNRFRLGAAQS